MKALCIDIGTTTGFAWGSLNPDDHNVMSGVWELKQGRFESAVVRVLNFVKMLDKMADSVGVDRVYFEEVRRHNSTDAAHWYGAFMMRLQEWCHGRNIPYESLPVGEIKKFTTGKGNANKDAMVKAVREWGFTPKDDNEADAIAMLRLVRWKAS